MRRSFAGSLAIVTMMTVMAEEFKATGTGADYERKTLPPAPPVPDPQKEVFLTNEQAAEIEEERIANTLPAPRPSLKKLRKRRG